MSEDDRTLLVGRDTHAVRLDREAILAAQVQLDRERMSRADTLPLPGGAKSDDPTPVRGTPALTVAPPVPPDAALPRTALADVAAGAAAAAAVSAGVTVGAFVAGTFGWAPPLVAATLGAAGLSLVYFITRSLFTRLLATFPR